MNDLDVRTATPVNNGRTAAMVTAGLAAGIVAIGVVTASAGDTQSGSLETAPSISCPSDARLVLPHVEGDNNLGYVLTPAQVVNAYVASQPTWTNSFANPLYTTERPIVGSSPSAVEVDVRDMALNRIGVFVATQGDYGYFVSRSFECGAKKA